MSYQKHKETGKNKDGGLDINRERELQQDSGHSNELHFTEYFQKNQHIVNALDDIAQARLDNLAIKSQIKKEQTELSEKENAGNESESVIVSTDNAELILQVSQGSTQAVELLQQKLKDSVENLIQPDSESRSHFDQETDNHFAQNYQSNYNLNDLTHQLNSLAHEQEQLEESVFFNSGICGIVAAMFSANLINFLHHVGIFNSPLFALVALLMFPLSIRLAYQLQGNKRQRIKYIEQEKALLEKTIVEEGEKAIAFTRQMQSTFGVFNKEDQKYYSKEQANSIVHHPLRIYKLMAKVKKWNLKNLEEAKNHHANYHEIIDYLRLEKRIHYKEKCIIIGSLIVFCGSLIAFKALSHQDWDFNFFIELVISGFVGKTVAEIAIKKNKTIKGLQTQLDKLRNKVSQLKQYWTSSEKKTTH